MRVDDLRSHIRRHPGGVRDLTELFVGQELARLAGLVGEDACDEGVERLRSAFGDDVGGRGRPGRESLGSGVEFGHEHVLDVHLTCGGHLDEPPTVQVLESLAPRAQEVRVDRHRGYVGIRRRRGDATRTDQDRAVFLDRVRRCGFGAHLGRCLIVAAAGQVGGVTVPGGVRPGRRRRVGSGRTTGQQRPGQGKYDDRLSNVHR